MLLASVGFSNPRDGVAVETGRSSRGLQSLAKKPPKTLAQRPPKPKQHADTDEACGQARVHLQPAEDRSFASAPPGRRTERPLLCDVCQFCILIFFLMDVADAADLPQRPPRVFRVRSAESHLAWPTVGPVLSVVLPRIRRARREGACTISPDNTLESGVHTTQ